jgi:hypothetical protein
MRLGHAIDSTQQRSATSGYKRGLYGIHNALTKISL